MKNQKLIFIILVLFFLIFTNIFTYLKKDNEYSNVEYRALSQKPAANRSNIFNGKYFRSLETYHLDQMFYRDKYVSLNSKLMSLMDVKIQKNRIFGNDGFLFALVNKDNYLQSELERLDEIRVKHLGKINNSTTLIGAKLIYLDIPGKSYLYNTKFPKYFDPMMDLQTKSRENLKNRISLMENAPIVVDTYDTLKDHTDDYLYYKTDHHYTFKGAYLSYNQLLDTIESLENKPMFYPKWEDMTELTTGNEFIGSDARTVGNPKLSNVDKNIYAFPSNYPTSFDRFDNGVLTNREIYVLSSVDTYGAYMGSDIANTVIKTNRPELPNILFYGDSFTNAIETMAIYNFNEMHSIDPRHYKGSVLDYIEEHNLDYVVVVRNTMLTEQHVK